MCCGGRVCMFCTCVILVVILIGLLFGFGVFKNGFHKLKDTIHVTHYPYLNNHTLAANGHGRPFFLGYAPPPF